MLNNLDECLEVKVISNGYSDFVKLTICDGGLTNNAMNMRIYAF